MKILIGKALQILIVVTTLVSAMELTGDEHMVKNDERRRLPARDPEAGNTVNPGPCGECHKRLDEKSNQSIFGSLWSKKCDGCGRQVNCGCKEPVYSCADCGYNLCGECNTRAVQREAAERQREQEREALERMQEEEARQQRQEEEVAQRFQEKVTRFQEKRAAKVVQKQHRAWQKRLKEKYGPIRFTDGEVNLKRQARLRAERENRRWQHGKANREFNDNRDKNIEFRKKRFQQGFRDDHGRDQPNGRSNAFEFVTEAQPSGRIVETESPKQRHYKVKQLS